MLNLPANTNVDK